MRIAMLGHKRMPSREGGVEVVVTELATRLASLGHDVTVYNRRGQGETGFRSASDGLVDYDGVRIRTVPTVEARGLSALSSSYFAMRAAVHDRPDVIHVHAEGPCAMLGMAARAGIRTVATIHGLDWQRAKWGWFASRYLLHGERVAARRADELIVLSRSTQDYFLKAYGRKTSYVPNGVSVREGVPADVITERHGLSEGSYVLFLGRVVPEKGVHHLVRAWGSVRTDKLLVIAGASSDTREYFDEVRRLAAGNPSVVFTGFVSGRELEELYSNACLYVLPSDLEGMPMSLLEAMAYGRCCLTSDIPECAEVVGDAGVTFPHGDVGALSRALRSLIDDPVRAAALGARARERVLSTYDWDAVVARTLDLYRGKAGGSLL